MFQLDSVYQGIWSKHNLQLQMFELKMKVIRTGTLMGNNIPFRIFYMHYYTDIITHGWPFLNQQNKISRNAGDNVVGTLNFIDGDIISPEWVV